MTGLADRLIDLIGSVPVWAVYLIAGGVVYLETGLLIAGLIVPSEAILLASGVAAAVGEANVVLLVVLVCACAVAGDMTGYRLGRVGGDRLRTSALGRRFGDHRWEQAQRRIHDSGMIVVGTGRWIGYVRTIVPRVAGMTRMRFARFWVADLVGAVTWATTVLLVGYFAGAVLGATILLYAVFGLLGLAVLLVVGKWVISRWHCSTDGVREEPVELFGVRSASAGGGLVVDDPARVPGGQPGADDELDLVKDHQRQHDQTDHGPAKEHRRHR